jgi:phosphoribosyl-ATP pyrophosphohydrolase/phosphoribosyl-AMP cyclohydrolase
MTVNFKKYSDGLVPAVIQDAATHKVLMLGFMNEAALKKTNELQQVTFFSRSKNRLWTKGEESGHFLFVQEIKVDCDNDTLLIKVDPAGPVCHTGSDTCWNEKNETGNFLDTLENVITERKQHPGERSYTSSLFARGINKMAQKVGEEAVELVIEAMGEDTDLFKEEAADLLFHYLILLQAKEYKLNDVIRILENRHTK